MVTTFAAEDLQPIAQFQELKDAQEHALVVLAMNLDCLITIEEDQSFLIHSDPAFALAIQEEFRLYAEEQEEQNDPPHIPIFSSGLELALLWVCSLLFFFVQQDNDPGFTERYLNSSHALVEHHEFYRPFTALFLHGDLEHLLGNVVFGLIFCVLVANSVGPFLGWILVLTSGFLGNTLNSILHYPDQFLSLGASTATFGALGILVGVGMQTAWISRSYRDGLRVFLPLAAGVILLSQMGVGGPKVDVAGHVLGFASGVLLGIPASLLRSHQAKADSTSMTAA